MVVGSFTGERVFPVNIDRIWKAGILDGQNLIPKVLPDFVSKIEMLEGDGGVGTIRMFHFTEAVKEFKYQVTKVDAIDHENHIVKFRVIVGALIGSRLKSLSFVLKFIVDSAGHTVEQFTADHETLDDTPLNAEEAEHAWNHMWIMGQAVLEYLLVNPTAYA